MSPKVDLNVHTQARAYQKGFQDALSFLVTILEENEGSLESLPEAIINNAAQEPTTIARMKALGF